MDIDRLHVQDITCPDLSEVRVAGIAEPLGAAGGESFGRGVTWERAEASARMEAAERYASGLPRAVAWRGSPADAESRAEVRSGALGTFGFHHVPVPRDAVTRDTPLEWVEGWEIDTDRADLVGRPVLVPMGHAVIGYDPPPGFGGAVAGSTNGVASGRSRMAALAHALCELVERDAESLDTAAEHIAPLIRDEAARQSADLGPAPLTSGTGAAWLRPETLPPPARALFDALSRGGRHVLVRDITTDVRVPSIQCLVLDTLDRREVITAGHAAHPDARRALLGALSEAAQGRAAVRWSGRPGGQPASSPPHLTHAARLARAEGEPWRDFEAMPSTEIDDDLEIARYVARRLEEAGLRGAVAVDLAAPAPGVSVVRALVPEAEVWPVYVAFGEQPVSGQRSLRWSVAAALGLPTDDATVRDVMNGLYTDAVNGLYTSE